MIVEVRASHVERVDQAIRQPAGGGGVNPHRAQGGRGEVRDVHRVRTAECIQFQLLYADVVHGDVGHVAEKVEMPGQRGEGDVLVHVGSVENQQVCARAAVDGVAAIAGIPNEGVESIVAEQQIAATPSDQRVVPWTAVNLVGTTASDEGVAARPAIDAQRGQHRIAPRHGVIPRAGLDDGERRQRSDECEQISARSSADRE